MGEFIKSIFGGTTDAEKAAKKQEEIAAVARAKQQEALQLEEKEVAGSRPPRGRRLLIAPETGEQGVTRASTLGGA